jgi:hypothetical protein
MREKVGAIDVGFVFELFGVVRHPHAGFFDVIYNMVLRTDLLDKCYCGRIPNAQIPKGIHGYGRVISHFTDALLLFDVDELFGYEAPKKVF